MANFTGAISVITNGLCESITCNDLSDYVNNTEGYEESELQFRKFTFRDMFGSVVKQETFTTNLDQSSTKSSTCPISLLTIGYSVAMDLYFAAPISSGYTVSKYTNITCLGI